MNASLDLALIGNCTVGALLDGMGRIVWGCYPRFDGDPVFCSLLNAEQDQGFFDIELIDFARAEQAYVENTAIVRTCLYDTRGGAVEILDFAPRFELFGRMFRPTMLVRRLRRLEGSPRVRVRLRPVCDNGRARPTTTWGSNHVRYVMPALALRLTTDVSITAILDETPFFLESTATLLLGPDETVHDSAAETGRRFLEETERYWQEWVRFLGIPFEWQEAVIRAAITLKLNAYDDTGAIIAAMTTSIPEAAEQRPQLGLPLLLAARRLFRGQCPEPPGRDAHHGALPGLHRQCRRQRRGRSCSRCTASTAGRASRNTIGGRAVRLPRHGPGAASATRPGAEAARCLWLGRAGVDPVCSSTSA
jgi:hypothetical protein